MQEAELGLSSNHIKLLYSQAQPQPFPPLPPPRLPSERGVTLTPRTKTSASNTGSTSLILWEKGCNVKTFCQSSFLHECFTITNENHAVL